jgi:gliding motility-associated-like protein
MKNTSLVFLLLLYFSTSFSQVNLNSGLLAYYPFNGNANDASGNGNNATFNNATLTNDRLGNPNSAYVFNGIDNFIQVPNSSSLNTTNQISICAWMKVSGFYPGPCHGNNIVMKGDGDYLPGNYMIRFDDSFFTNNQNCSITTADVNHESFFGLGSTPYSTTPFIKPDQWYSVVYTCDGSTAKIYVNCQLVGSGPVNGISFSNSYDLFLGKLNSAQYPYWFNGVMDEVRIYNRPINADEVNAYGDCSINASTASFTAPDTVCVNTPVQIMNTSVGASNYFWNFCTANINQPPSGTNLGNVGGLLSAPVYIDYVFTNGNYYGFVTNNYPGGLLRLDFGNSLLNAPAVTNLGNVGGAIPNNTEGVQIANDNGKWYVLIVGGDVAGGSIPSLTTVSIGTNITNNTPTATNWGNIGNLSYPHDLYVFNDNGHWYGLTVNYSNSTVTRFDLTTSLSNAPSATNLGNIGNLSGPTGIQAINDNGNWRVFVTNATSSTLTRLDFGSSLLNIPTGVNLGNPGNTFVTCWDIYILRYCGENEAFVINANGSYDIVKLDFGGSLLNNPTAVSLGNQGNLKFPHCLSKLFRVGPDVFSLITNVDNNTLSLLQFPGCTNASIPNSTVQNPPAITYNIPGTYNINLTVDDGLPTQTSYCKQVVVENCEKIINDYTEVLGFNICKNELTVKDASKYNAGDTVLLIQMKGAVIDSSNTSNFGTVTNYKNAGNYEYNYVKQKTGNVIQLKNLITRQYDIPTGKVQLIRVPYYDNLTTDNKLTCLPWDGSKGGVLAFNVKNTLTMNADIDVSGKGFIGGQVINPKNNSFYCHENNYYYPNDPIKAAPKGEGIAMISDQKIFGKGALSNGGGGGLEHNSGGGGGSNITNGGLGGKEWITCGPPINNNGIGGKPLTYSNVANKIFLGGGGGAGHCDNIPGFNPVGGNGGGIVIIKSNSIKTNNNLIIANGDGGVECFRDAQAYKCHEGMGGGGGGGAILIDASSFLDNTNIHVNGGKGADMNGEIQGQLGPGGGGGGGVCWVSNAALPGNILITQNGGINGVNIDFGNDSYGATPGQAGSNLLNLKIPIDSILFKPNIDSVRIKDSVTACSSFDFKGLGYTNTAAINSWKWSFGDGSTDVQQNTSHTYSASGTYTVKLVVTDVNGCKDSITRDISANSTSFDFSYEQEVCDPLSVKFTNTGAGTINPYWSFGDGSTITGTLIPSHTYALPGNYSVKFSVQNGGCIDTIAKTISLAIIPADIIITPDTIICINSTKQLRTVPSLNFCWSPVTYLDNPLSPNPVTSAPQNITYYFTAQVTGTNIINNGNFDNGNTGFTSEYSYANPNVTEGQYFVGKTPQAWNASMSACGDHTTGNGNMMLVNGSPAANINVWKQTVTVTPNTNYAFSTWIEALFAPNPAQLNFSINGIDIGYLITASLPTCTWTQFFTTWNSGNNTSATISIVNKNTFIQGNDFALDDISFAPVLVKRDSVKISVNTPFIESTNDTAVCSGSKIQLQTSGANTYSWTPSTGLSNSAIPNPVATVSNSIAYIVNGVNNFGCIAKDTVNLTALSLPVIIKSNDTVICNNTSVQIFASGGNMYSWSPAVTLSNSHIPNPIASPSSTTKYFVTVTGNNLCSNTDSVSVKINPPPVFSVSPNSVVCSQSSTLLQASGGDTYIWSPADGLNNPNISNPMSTPGASITYTVIIHENTCNETGTLSTNITVLSLPDINATSSNDLTCSLGSSQLNATGATSYTWSPSTGLNNNNIANPVATPSNTTLYKVTGRDINGCSNSDTVIVKADFNMNALYLLPNSFTPNGDGINDCFGIKYWGVVKELDFSIYNRFGERVFHSNSADICWDGTYKQKLQDVNVFVYVITAKTACGIINRKGTVALLK